LPSNELTTEETDPQPPAEPQPAPDGGASGDLVRAGGVLGSAGPAGKAGTADPADPVGPGGDSRWQRLRLHQLTVKLGRYSIGSVIALACSEAALALCYGTDLTGTTVASVVAFFAGAVPNYLLNRNWVWKLRGRVHLGKELLPYVLTSVVALVASAAATGLASSAARNANLGHSLRVGVVAAAYLAIQALLFVVKFAIYEVVVFKDRSRPASRSSYARSADARSPGAASGEGRSPDAGRSANGVT
jgi:putative flippase GtrA